MLKRMISLFLCMVMVISMLPVQAFATEDVTEPVEMVTEPTEGESAPTEPVTEPTAEPTVYTEAVTEPIEETTAPTEPETEPTEVVPEPTMESVSKEPAMSTASTETVIASGICGDNVTWTLDQDGTLVISGAGSMYNYSNRNSAPWYANRESIFAVKIESTVDTIGDHAFDSCNSLAYIEIPNSVTSIGNYAFTNCDGLINAKIGDISASFDNKATTIGNSAFEDCGKLSGIIIGNNVGIIGDDAFYNCDSLSNAKMGNNVSFIGKGAFFSCNTLGSVIIPDSVITIGDSAFGYCNNLVEVVIGNSVNFIGNRVFYRCPKLAGIWVDKSNECYCSDDYGVLFDKNNNVLIQAPGSLSGSYSIPDNVIVIGNDAFDNCKNLTNITIPNSVVTIGDSAFFNCIRLNSITIPDSVTAIKYQTFYSCSSLTNVIIGRNIAAIGYAAFEHCNSLTSIVFKGNAPYLESAFYYVTATAYYPQGNMTWTSDFMKFSYGGKITWIPYDTKDADTMFVDQVSVICYANQNEAADPNEKFVLSPKMTATVGPKVYYADSNGQITISGEPQDWVTFSQEEYVSRSFTLQELSDNNTVYLQKESDGPVIHALWSDKTDILHTELALYYASDAEISLTPEIDWGGSKDSLILYQDGISVSIFEGSNSIKLASEFDINKEIYLIATNGNGKQAKKLLKITNKTETGLDGFTFDLGDSLSFTLPESAGLLAGTKMDLGLYSKVPVKVAVVDGRVYATFGVQWDGSLDGSGDVEVKNSAQAIKKLRNAVEDCTAGMKEYKYVRDVMKNFGYKTAKLSGSCGVDGNWTLLGYVEGYLDSNRNFILSDSGGIMSFGASVDYTQPFMAGPVPMFFELSFSGDIESQFNLYINQKIKKFTPKVEIEGVLALKGGIGVGAAKVASLSGGLKGSLINNINFNLGVLEYYRLTAALDWYIKLKLLFLSFDDGDTITKATWYEYPDPGATVMALGLDDEEPDTGGGKPDYYDTSQYTMDDLSYLSYGSSFMGGGVSTFSGRSLNNNAPFVANAYEGADPQTVTFSDGTRLAVWIGYNENYSGADALNLYYSYYNGAWSQPQLVEQDGTTDAYPDLKVINDTAYLVWQDASGSIGSDATLDSIATMMDISGAVFDKETVSFAASAITSGNGVLNMQPKLCGDSSAVYVVWRRNDENDWFGQNNSNSLWYSSFSGGSWNSPSALYSGLAPLLDFDVTCSGGSCIVAYTMDGDGDLNTTEDLEVYKNGVALTDNDWLDSGVTFSGTDLYWYSGGKLVKNGNDTMPEGVLIGSDRFQIVNENGVHAVVYAEEDGLASVLKAAYYDASSGCWGTPKTLYSAGTSISAFSASATVDGEISVLIQNQDIIGDFDGTDPYGTVNLVWYNAPMGCDIRLDDVRYYNEQYVQNNDMPVYITVTNAGELTVQKLQVTLTDEAGTVVQAETVNQQILSGETKEIKIAYYVKAVVPGRTLTLNVTPVDMEDVFTEDNSDEMVLGWEDLSVENLRAGITEDGKIIIHANIVNRGYQPQETVTVHLREKTVSGTILKTLELESIEELSRQAVSFTLGESLCKVYYVTIDRKESECNSANNSDFINISTYLGDDVIYGENALVINMTDIGNHTSVWVDGAEYTLKQFDTTYYVNLPNGVAKTMIAYTYHVGKDSDIHTQYPVNMKVWTLSNEEGLYTATRVEELDDILQYSGASIRVTGKKGIRMITAMNQAKKNDLISDGLAGYTLKEYGTVVAWASQLGGNPLVLDQSYAKSNYAYKKDVADPVFAYAGDLMQYTNVLVGFTTSQCKNDLAMRPYMILEDADGNEITLYGGTVTRSIGYIAYQNRAAFTPGTDAYKYVWDIIHSVYGDAYDAEYVA